MKMRGHLADMTILEIGFVLHDVITWKVYITNYINDTHGLIEGCINKRFNMKKLKIQQCSDGNMERF